MRYDIYVRLRDAMDEFVESEHPRDDDGKFTDKNGGSSSGKKFLYKGHEIERFESPNEESFVINNSEKEIGGITIRKKDNKNYVTHINVAPEYKRQGIGRALLEVAEMRNSNLIVPVTSEEGKAFWTKMGYQPGGNGQWTKHAESSPAKYQPLPDEIKINGNIKKTENSSGARISKTEKGTRKFWDWFGNSKATDDENRPLELYHGTDATFGNFAISNVDDAYFFTPSRAVARRFTSKKDVIETIPGTNIIAHIDNPGIKRVYLKMENVAEYDGETLGAGEERDWRIKADKAQGRDGVIIRNADTGNGIADEYIVFDPKNIKYVDDFLEDAE